MILTNDRNFWRESIKGRLPYHNICMYFQNNVLLSGGDNLLNKTTTNYICQSLFDQQSPENLGIPISKILDFDEHRQVYISYLICS